MKKLVFGLVIAVLLIRTGVVSANQSTGSGILGSESSPSGIILQKLTQLKNEIASKAAEIKAEIGKKIENRAWSGVIVSKNLEAIVINTGKEQRQINVNQYTAYVTGKAKGQGALKDLTEGDFIVAIGDVDDKNNLQAKKVVRSKSVKIGKSLVWGQILGTDNPTISLKTIEGNKKIQTNGNTDFWLGSKEASFIDAKKDKFLLAVVSEGNNITSNAETVYFIPTVGYFKPEKVASSSATPSASPAKKASESTKKK